MLHIGRADCLVRVLRILAPGVDIWLGGVVFRAIALQDRLLGRSTRFLGNTRRVGTHIGDEADRFAVVDLDALVQPLRHHHRALGRKAELARRVLLQGARRERRIRLALPRRLLGLCDGEFLPADSGQNLLHLRLALGDELLLALAEEGRLKSMLALHIGQDRLDRPIFLRLEIADLPFAVDDQLDGRGLHAPGAQPAAHLLPQKRRQLIPHEAVEHTARLLRIDASHVDLTRVLDRVCDGRLGNLVELDAVHILFFLGERPRDVPGDCLSLAVRVGREIDLIGLLSLLF